MRQPTTFTHRAISGWISDFSSVPSRGAWPDITLDQRLMADLNHAFKRAQQAGYNEIILWGLLCGRAWNPYLPDTFDTARKEKVRQLIDAARGYGLKVLIGLGVYSWGFEEIIHQDATLDGGTHRLMAMCGARPESQACMREIVDFVLGECAPDGLSMQSSDQGRCGCDACQEQSAMAYHARINDETAAYVRSRQPGLLLHLSSWGMGLGNPADLPHIQHMSAHLDVLNDYNNSAAVVDPAYRKTLVDQLPCAYGTEAGWYIDPPPFWTRDRWFVPLALRNVPYFRALAADGANAVERYILPLANPGAEVGFIFDGLIFNAVNRDPHDALSEALAMVFEPRTHAAVDALIDLWQLTEAAYLDNSRAGASPQQFGLNQDHYNLAPPDPYTSQRPEYLLRLKPEGLRAYTRALGDAQALVQRIRSELANISAASRLERCVVNGLADAERVLAVRG